jgi:glyoxylase I family protein
VHNNLLGDAKAYGATCVDEDCLVDGDLVTARTGGHCHLFAGRIIEMIGGKAMASTSFAHVGLNCRDMTVTERFYARHFGFRRVRAVPLGNTQIVFLRAGDTALELFQAEGESLEPAFDKDGPAYPGIRHIAFQVDNVDRKLKELEGSAKVTLGPMSFDNFIQGWRSAWIQDPDGRIVEISQGYRDAETAKEME